MSLDRRIPFVKAALEFVEKRATIDAAAEILSSAESRHGARIFLMDPAGRIPGGLHRPTDGLPKFTAERVCWVLEGFMGDNYAPATAEAGEIEAHRKALSGVLSDCGLIVAGAELVLRGFVAYDDGCIESLADRGVPDDDVPFRLAVIEAVKKNTTRLKAEIGD